MWHSSCCFVLGRLEKLGLKSRVGQAKVVGTIACVGGAILLSFYNGPVVPIGKSKIHWEYAEKTGTKDSMNHVNLILGPLLLILSAVSWAVWLIIQVTTLPFQLGGLKNHVYCTKTELSNLSLSIFQTRVSQKYSAPYSSSALMCMMASVQCVIVGFLFDHNLSAWSLNQSIRIVSSIYSVCHIISNQHQLIR